jgi:hypothetical protein
MAAIDVDTLYDGPAPRERWRFWILSCYAFDAFSNRGRWSSSRPLRYRLQTAWALFISSNVDSAIVIPAREYPDVELLP